jgi:hypothetical protein
LVRFVWLQQRSVGPSKVRDDDEGFLACKLGLVDGLLMFMFILAMPTGGDLCTRLVPYRAEESAFEKVLRQPVSSDRRQVIFVATQHVESAIVS